jgi:hypothetical protein
MRYQKADVIGFFFCLLSKLVNYSPYLFQGTELIRYSVGIVYQHQNAIDVIIVTPPIKIRGSRSVDANDRVSDWLMFSYNHLSYVPARLVDGYEERKGQGFLETIRVENSRA